MVANKYAFLQITRRRFLNEWEAFKKVISRRNIRTQITIHNTISNLKLLRRRPRTETIPHINDNAQHVRIQSTKTTKLVITKTYFTVNALNPLNRRKRNTTNPQRI